MSFWGFPRPDGSVGTRNHVGVISTVTCANDIAQWISDQVPGCVHFTHQQGCGQSKPDMEIVHRTLIGLGRNPNLAAVLLVSLGCEGNVDHILEGIAAAGKPVEKVMIQASGGLPDHVLDILFDPQTSGGLFIAVSSERADRLVSRLHQSGVAESAVVGEVIAHPEGKIVVEE